MLNYKLIKTTILRFRKPKIEVRQHDTTDCGAACLSSISAHYKLHIPIARIRQFTGTDKQGTNILGLLEAANSLGFEAKGVRGELASLQEIPIPAIAHIKLDNGFFHYVVIYKTTLDEVTYMDPADGKMYTKSNDAFTSIWTGVLVILQPREDFEEGNYKQSISARFWSILKPHKSVLILAFLGSVIYTLLGFSTSIYIQKITDEVISGDGSFKLLNMFTMIMLFLMVARIGIGVLKDIIIIRTGQKIDKSLILDYYKHLLKLPQPFFDGMRVGEIISRVNDAVKIRYFLNNVSLNLSVNILVLIFSFALMFVYHWKLAALLLIVIPLYGVVYYLVDKLNKKTERQSMERAAELKSQLVESLNAVDTIKRFGLEDFANDQTEKRFEDVLDINYKSYMNYIFAVSSSSFIAQFSTIILLWAGSYFVLRGKMTLGELMSFYAIMGYAIGPISSLIGANKQIQNALIATDRLFEIMDLEREKDIEKKMISNQDLGDITFENVSFRYGTRVQVFDDFNLTIPKGKITAIIGESGSGKSTLISLIQNLYPLKGGCIKIGEHDINTINNNVLRKLISAVPQKIDLFTGDIYYNITIGDPNPDLKLVKKICDDLAITSFIESLPDGFETNLGENGASLSGGQKQKIAIARALYKQPEILVLDEATSSLDTNSEGHIQRAINTLSESNKTIIIIAHRLRTVINADQIVVLNKGKVVEIGNHKELYDKKENYYQLWQQQLPSELSEC